MAADAAGDDLLRHERQVWAEGFVRIAGVDEVGRGPLAGPVVAAAVVFDRAFAEAELHGALRGLTDSKQLAASQRERFHALLIGCPHADIGLGMADVDEIDRINILRATHAAMARAVAGLTTPPDYILVDGLPVPGLPCRSTALVRGDARSLSIAAASVVAKVVRDAQMRKLDAEYPAYGFARHKGYGSQAHIQALYERGPCPLHRRSFRPVREAKELHRRLKEDGAGGEGHEGERTAP